MSDTRRGKLDELTPDQQNANKGTAYGAHLLEKSIQELGLGRSVLVDRAGNLIAGNKTAETAAALGLDNIIIVPTDGKTLVVVQRTDIDINSREGRQLALADNKVGELNLSWDADEVASLSEQWDINLKEWGFVDPEPEKPAPATADQNVGSLADRFVVPPFSVLDTRQGYWQDRKKLWNARIGDQGESRLATLRKSLSADDPSYYRQKTAAENKMGRKMERAEFETDHYVRSTKLPKGVSLLDPVLSELVVKWFGIAGGQAFDPFAGDSVFGFVAAASGMSFTGIELRKEQAELNQARIDAEGLPGKYICGDALDVDLHIPADSQDLLFSCPPYFDLEVYSDDVKDASNQKTYGDFYRIIDIALTNAAKCLKDNRFAVIVVGDVRNKTTGAYYGFHIDIINTMRSAGLHFYNDCVLVEQAGNAAIRANGQMKHRKVVKTHQQVLVFYKGNPRDVKNHFPEIVYESQDLESFGVDTDDESDEAED